ncbi:retrovirus-related Pol polyprotein from transposon TNT 1-94 [Trichonephila clavipes]|nr:retrovirus-related Pol polyprotein from transposon TNT 1-94 [Trichonephila clavipes]
MPAMVGYLNHWATAAPMLKRNSPEKKSLPTPAIEHVWDALGRRLAARIRPPGNIQQLKYMPIEEWVLLPQELRSNLVLMDRRSEAIIALRGGHIPY